MGTVSSREARGRNRQRHRDIQRECGGDARKEGRRHALTELIKLISTPADAADDDDDGCLGGGCFSKW